MEDITDVYFTPLTESSYVRPFRFNYTQQGRQKNWDLLEVHDSVAIVIFNITRKKVIFVKQFRPAVYFSNISAEDRSSTVVDTEKYPPSLGVTLEMCAGIVDKTLPLDQIACEEVLEECGYKVEPKDLEKVITYRSGVGVQGSEQTLYYVEVTDAMKHNSGGGVDDEIIEVVELSIPETEQLVLAPSASGAGGAGGVAPCPPSCLFAVMWFLHYKADKFRKSFEHTCGECKEGRSEKTTPLVPVVREEQARRGGECRPLCPPPTPAPPPRDR